MRTTRRSFLKHSSAAALMAPTILPSAVWSAETSPNARIGMGFIGMGRQQGSLLGNFLGQGTQCLAVCDVDTTRREDSKKRVDDYYAKQSKKTPCASYTDFRQLLDRKDIDAVSIATPDHWHACQILAALQAGKDVYCEKPLTHNIHESIEVLKAVDAHGRVLQTGSMQRSSKEFRIACELVLNGAIGQVQRVECAFGDPSVPCDLPEEAMEPGLDWNLWLGPAQVRPYNSVLSPRGIHKHFPAWRRYQEFGGGGVADWGAHHLDIAQWGLGMDASGPVEVLPPPKAAPKPAKAGAKPGDDRPRRGAKFVYANGVTLEHKDGFGVHFFGSEGEVMVNRGKFAVIVNKETIASFTDKNDRKTSCAAQVQKAEKALLKDAKIKLYVSTNHPSDFLACVQSRNKPITSEQVGARSAICCHLINLAYHHMQKMQWDPAKFCFTNGTGDPAWLTRDYRAPFSV